MRAEIAELKRCLCTETLLNRSAPLLDILWRRIGLEGSEANRRRSQHSRTEVEVTRDDSRCGHEIIALLRFRKHERHVVTLVAPRVHINRCEKDSERSVQNEAVLMQVVRDTEARRKFEFVGVVQTLRKPLLPADKYSRRPILKCQIGVCITNVHKRTHVLVAKPDLDRCIARHLETVVNKGISVPLSKLHLRNAGLPLLHSGQTEQKTRQRRTGAIIGGSLCSET